MTPLSDAKLEVPGRGPIADSFNPVEPIDVFVYASLTAATLISAPALPALIVVPSMLSESEIRTVGSSRTTVRSSPLIATSSAVLATPLTLNVTVSPAEGGLDGAEAIVMIWSAPRSTTTAFIPLPHVPAERAANILVLPTPDVHAVSFLTRTPPPLAAFCTPLEARTTASLPP